MSPTALTPRVQALESKVQTLQTTTPVPASTQATPSGFNFLTQQEVVLSQSAAGATGWVQYTSKQVPASATALILTTYARIDANIGTSYDLDIQGRANTTGTAVNLWGSHSDGIDTDTEGNLAWSFPPAYQSGFQYNAPDHVKEITVTLVGYIA